jgi:hypothetical protein
MTLLMTFGLSATNYTKTEVNAKPQGFRCRDNVP